MLAILTIGLNCSGVFDGRRLSRKFHLMNFKLNIYNFCISLNIKVHGPWSSLRLFTFKLCDLFCQLTKKPMIIYNIFKIFGHDKIQVIQ